MKCLLLADLHYDLRKFDWVVEAAADVDVVVLAGDHLDVASLVARPAQAMVVQAYFRRIRARADLIVSSGNHDVDSKDANGELVSRWLARMRHLGIPVDGDSHRIGETLFTVCPWIDGERQQARVEDLIASDHARRPPTWIWVTHAPPKGSPTSWGGQRSFGDPWLGDWITRFRPDIVLSGHVHQSPFVEGGSWRDRIGDTWVFNAGHQFGPLPTSIVIDTDDPSAAWQSLAGAQEIGLAERPAAP